VEVDAFVFEAAPQAFDEHIVHPTAAEGASGPETTDADQSTRPSSRPTGHRGRRTILQLMRPMHSSGERAGRGERCCLDCASLGTGPTRTRAIAWCGICCRDWLNDAQGRGHKKPRTLNAGLSYGESYRVLSTRVPAQCSMCVSGLRLPCPAAVSPAGCIMGWGAGVVNAVASAPIRLRPSRPCYGSLSLCDSCISRLRK
jgi:hypothetical protein